MQQCLFRSLIQPEQFQSNYPILFIFIVAKSIVSTLFDANSEAFVLLMRRQLYHNDPYQKGNF